jgi:LysM repeat protein
MKAIRDLSIGLITTLASTILVVGAMLLAIAEGTSFPRSTQIVDFNTPPPTHTPAPPVSTRIASIMIEESASPTPSKSFSPTPSQPIPTTCPNPAGWGQYTILSGDTVALIASDYGITPKELMDANCLISETLLPGTILFIPPPPATLTPSLAPIPTRTSVPSNTPIPCGPPKGWVTYIVQYGDTLFRISLQYGATVNQLQFANCMGSSTTIRAGQGLYVPNTAPVVPTPTRTSTRTPIPPTKAPATAIPLPTANMTATFQQQTQDAQGTQAAHDAATQAAANATNTQAALNATNTQAAINATNTQAAINATNTQAAINATNTQAAVDATNAQATIDASNSQTAVSAAATSACLTLTALNTPCPP